MTVAWLPDEDPPAIVTPPSGAEGRPPEASPTMGEPSLGTRRPASESGAGAASAAPRSQASPAVVLPSLGTDDVAPGTPTVSHPPPSEAGVPSSESGDPTGRVAPSEAVPHPSERGVASVAPRRRITKTPAEALANVRFAGRTLDDIERLRKSTGNRLGAAKRAGLFHIDAPTFLHGLEGIEREAILELKRSWRQYPLAPWAETVPGVGEKLIARLIAEIGDPLVRVLGAWEGEGGERRWVETGRERRTLEQLRAYCGHGDPRRRRAAGMTQEEAFKGGNPAAKMRLFLIAESGTKFRCAACVREGKAREGTEWIAPPADCSCAAEDRVLRVAYDRARARYATRVHGEDAPRGLKPGDPWRSAHQHQAALRYAGKTFLRLLYRAAGDVEQGHSSPG